LTNGFFAAFAVLLFLALIATLVRHYLHSRRTSEASWEDLLKQLTWVDRDAIARVARDVLEDPGGPGAEDSSFALEPPEIWKLLGGLEGLNVIEHNCHVLVELAAYVQRWYPEALVVAEQMRLNAREIEWHVGRLKGAAQTGNLQTSFADYAQRAVATYYLMTRHLIELYEQGNLPGLAELQRAI
jgi:hypothetical protein